VLRNAAISTITQLGLVLVLLAGSVVMEPCSAGRARPLGVNSIVMSDYNAIMAFMW
jgi:ABC-type dipeptide/oligopeptide/nickel transport system permease component